MAHYKKKRSRSPKEYEFKNPISLSYRRITNLINRGEIEEALSELNRIGSRPGLQITDYSIIASLTADSQFALGRFDTAILYYQSSQNYLKENSRIRIWLRPALGEIRCLLKTTLSEDAVAKATEVWERALHCYKQHEEELALSNRQLEENGPTKVDQRPIRPSVVLTKIAKTFLEEGYTGVARQYFQQAVLSSPRGATRARQGLARICLAEGENASAEQYARESLQMGKFQVKTITAWSLLIAARAKQGKPLLDSELFTSLHVNQDGSIKARSILEIVKSLRSFDDPAWKEIAGNWVSNESESDEIIEVELSKILLTDAKYEAFNPDLIGAAAHRILRNPQASPQEMIACSKEIVRSLIAKNQYEPPVNSLASKISRRFNLACARKARHAMALGAMLASGQSIARQILLNQIGELVPGSAQWGKDVFALARMEFAAGNYSEAATGYLMIAEQSGIPEAFRVQSLLEWLKSAKAGASFSAEDLVSAREKLLNITAAISDYDVLLDVGRHLALGDASLSGIRDEVIGAACLGAMNAFESAGHPSDALAVLIRLTRRRYYDFKKKEEVVAHWEAMSYEKKDWLWTNDSRYWEYLALVVQSYFDLNRVSKGSELANGILESGNVPSAGLVFVGTTLANHQVISGQSAKAMIHLRWLVHESPTHRWSSWGFYWLALDALSRNDQESAASFGKKIRKCFSGNPSLLWHWKLDACGLLLQFYLEELDIPSELMPLYDLGFVRTMKLKIQSDLKFIQ